MPGFTKTKTCSQRLKTIAKGSLSQENYLEAATLFSYQYLRGFPQLDEDSRQDFILTFLPYLKKKIKSFRPYSISLEDFLKHVIRKRIVSFLINRCKHLTYGNILTDCLSDESSEKQETSPSLPIMPLAEALGVFQPNRYLCQIARRRLLLVALRQAYRLREDDIPQLASLCQLKEGYLIRLLNKLKKIICPKEGRLARLRERRNLLFLRILFLEQKRQTECDLLKRQILTDLLAQKRMVFNRLIKEIARPKLVVPHTLLARLLNLSRGSVSSDLSRANQLIRGFVLRQRSQSA